MEEAISKFMEGMEQQEHTGFNALHKLLQGLPVPVQKNGRKRAQPLIRQIRGAKN